MANASNSSAVQRIPALSRNVLIFSFIVFVIIVVLFPIDYPNGNAKIRNLLKT